MAREAACVVAREWPAVTKRDGSVPADNPIPGDAEWCRGLRNPFGLAVHAALPFAFSDVCSINTKEDATTP